MRVGRHRAAPEGSRWRRSSAPAVVPAPRRPGIEVVDALTKLAHRVSPEELVTGHQRGISWRCAVSGSKRRAWSSPAGAAAGSVRGE